MCVSVYVCVCVCDHVWRGLVSALKFALSLSLCLVNLILLSLLGKHSGRNHLKFESICIEVVKSCLKDCFFFKRKLQMKNEA